MPGTSVQSFREGSHACIIAINRSCLNNPEVLEDYDIHYLLYLTCKARHCVTAYACAMNESSYMQIALIFSLNYASNIFN
jgi:hypothetical protein